MTPDATQITKEKLRRIAFNALYHLYLQPEAGRTTVYPFELYDANYIRVTTDTYEVELTWKGLWFVHTYKKHG